MHFGLLLASTALSAAIPAVIEGSRYIKNSHDYSEDEKKRLQAQTIKAIAYSTLSTAVLAWLALPAFTLTTLPISIFYLGTPVLAIVISLIIHKALVNPPLPSYTVLPE